ncbi:MAG: SUMF1/EgtB/PvdO family nonheme iron enzyme, partial [Thermoanaerobaculia bacterium]
EAARLFARARATLDAAIQTDPGCQEARKALADLYWDRFQEAEARRDPLDAALHRGLVEAYDTGQYAVLLKGDGSLSLRTDPPGAEALLYRCVEENRVLVPREARVLGRTPFGPVALPMGSYLAVLRLPGYVEARYPVFIGRSENHAGVIRLHTEARIGAGFVQVPAGEFIRGGDPLSSGGVERSRVHVEEFFIARFPVTMGEYCEFLDALAARGEPVAEHISRMADSVYIKVGPDGRHRPSEDVAVEANLKRHQPGYEVNCPALAVSWHSAMAYARWRSQRDGRQYTLPPEEAWEKAARGVDGRFHPWGDRFDWTFTKGGLSRPERSEPEPVGAFPMDESPYGARDMAGTIREWTGSWFDESAARRVVRGGAWNIMGENHFRCANRLGYPDSGRTSTVGFRLYSERPARGSAAPGGR